MPSHDHMSRQFPAPSKALVQCHRRGTLQAPRRFASARRASRLPPWQFFAALASAQAPSHPVHHAPVTSGGFSLMPAPRLRSPSVAHADAALAVSCPPAPRAHTLAACINLCHRPPHLTLRSSGRPKGRHSPKRYASTPVEES